MPVTRKSSTAIISSRKQANDPMGLYSAETDTFAICCINRSSFYSTTGIVTERDNENGYSAS